MAFILCLFVVVLTWNGFPGGWIKNRLQSNVTESKLKRAKQRYNAFLAENGLTHPLKDISIKIVKSERKLFLYSEGGLLKTYQIGLGGSPEGHKKIQGDQKTPVGEYYICTRNEQSRFNLFLGLSYPGIKDARRGLSEGLISKPECKRIEEVINDKQKPPWHTALGGAIGIHGSGSNYDWTLGCIALDDADIEELWFTTKFGTPVFIVENE